jgi:hypothetical protein
MFYPKSLYRPADNEKGFESIVVNNEAEHKALGAEVFESPAEFGVITQPSAEQQLEMHSPTYREHMAKWKSKKEKKDETPPPAPEALSPEAIAPEVAPAHAPEVPVALEPKGKKKGKA